MIKISVSPDFILTFFNSGSSFTNEIENGLPKGCRFIRIEQIYNEVNQLMRVDFYFLEPKECLEFPFEIKQLMPIYKINNNIKL